MASSAAAIMASSAATASVASVNYFYNGAIMASCSSLFSFASLYDSSSTFAASESSYSLFFRIVLSFSRAILSSSAAMTFASMHFVTAADTVVIMPAAKIIYLFINVLLILFNNYKLYIIKQT